MTIDETRTALYRRGLVSIIRGEFTADETVRLAQALHRGGITCVEVTLNNRHALAAIRTLRRAFSAELLIGAGTVRNADDVQRACEAGSAFLVAPCLDLDAIAMADRYQQLLVPGVFTATEAQAAFRAGCRTVKLFPAGALGPSYLQALRAPLDQIDFIPTGGVDESTVGAFHRAGAVAFGVGSALVKKEIVDADALTRLTQRAARLVDVLREARADAAL
jgi:2-dehydro-3-deoxyphosphogluconate aldolase/(4S)-4-hydroxy-2-oxoglutarate aldolase